MRSTCAELDRQLETEPNGRGPGRHAGARASLPDADAKAWAWSCFTGEVDLPNYELEAVGLGFWRGGQEELTEPYVDRYFADLPDTVGCAAAGSWRTPRSTSSRPPR